MPAFTAQRASSNATDASFRAWGSWISACLLAAGWVKTADTGQINWATVTTPAAINTAQGYEIWRMADALQSTAPIYLKLEFGSGAAALNPAIWHTFATGSDGAGTLTGTTSGRVQTLCSSNSATTFDWVASGDTNRFVFASAVLAANGSLGMYLMVERTHDGSGADTGAGLLIAYGGGGGSVHAQKYWPHGSAVPGTEATLGVLMPTFGTGTDGTTTAVYPLMLSRGPFLDPPLGLLGGFLANFTPGVTVPLAIYGATHTYYPAGSTFASISRAATANASALLIRYE